MRGRTFAVAVSALALGLGLAACGSDNNSSSTGSTSSSGGGGKTVDLYSSLPLQGASKDQTGALVNGVTVERTHYKMLSAAAGMKYHGFWLQGEGYGRRLDNFVADGKLPVGVVQDTGFYVQVAKMIVPNRFELYGTTSYIFSDYGHPKEFIVGGNYYPWNTRNIRLNTQLINVGHSPVSSTFGFYVGQLTGQVFSFGVTALY